MVLSTIFCITLSLIYVIIKTLIITTYINNIKYLINYYIHIKETLIIFVSLRLPFMRTRAYVRNNCFVNTLSFVFTKTKKNVFQQICTFSCFNAIGKWCKATKLRNIILRFIVRHLLFWWYISMILRPGLTLF